jgi:aspartate/methionine/tyrosine aminotransferase
MGYPPYEGDPELVEMVRELTKRFTGKNFKHITITAGCTNAVMASIYALSNNRTECVGTRDLCYLRYPHMVNMAGLLPTDLQVLSPDDIALVDSPSNPLGEVLYHGGGTTKVIWDGAYHSPLYGVPEAINSVPEASIFCGSLSKLTSLNGLRLGWTATNYKELHDSVVRYNRFQLCGVSVPSQEIAKEILKDQGRFDLYMVIGRGMIDRNREIVSKLGSLLGNQTVPDKGMFALFEVDDKAEELFKRANVQFTDGRECGARFQSVRVSLGNSVKDTQDMLGRILKADGR